MMNDYQNCTLIKSLSTGDILKVAIMSKNLEYALIEHPNPKFKSIINLPDDNFIPIQWKALISHIPTDYGQEFEVGGINFYSRCVAHMNKLNTWQPNNKDYEALPNNHKLYKKHKSIIDRYCKSINEEFYIAPIRLDYKYPGVIISYVTILHKEDPKRIYLKIDETKFLDALKKELNQYP